MAKAEWNGVQMADVQNGDSITILGCLVTK